MSEYQEYGHVNDKPTQIKQYVYRPLVKQLGQKNARVILDVGCGNGWLTRDLISQGYDAYGIDASERGIKIARESYPDRFFVQDVTTNELPAPIREVPFNTVISTEVIEHLYNPDKYLDFLRNALKGNPLGELILTAPYHGYFKNLVLAVTGKMDAHFNAERVGGHIKFFSRRTITRMLEKHGFQVVHFEGCGRMPYLWKSMLIKAVVRANA